MGRSIEAGREQGRVRKFTNSALNRAGRAGAALSLGVAGVAFEIGVTAARAESPTINEGVSEGNKVGQIDRFEPKAMKPTPAEISPKYLGTDFHGNPILAFIDADHLNEFLRNSEGNSVEQIIPQRGEQLGKYYDVLNPKDKFVVSANSVNDVGVIVIVNPQQ